MPFVDDSEEDEKYSKSEVAYEQWKVRELMRLKRDHEERTKYEVEQKEIERRRNLTEEERLAED